MFKNYFRTAWRNTVRNKTFSILNILGLALGLACSLLIFLWVKDETSMDDYHQRAPYIYNVYERVFSDGKLETARWTPGQLARELKRKIQEIQYATGFNEHGQSLFEAGNKILKMTGDCADSDFFKMFSYLLIEGTSKSALNGPGDIAISRRMADVFFGSPHAAYGKMIRYDNYKDFKISAVFENLPVNSSQKFDYICNWDFLLDTVSWLKEWIYRGPATYIQLQPQANPARVEAKIKNFLQDYLNTKESAGFHLELGMQRFDKMYLNGNFKDGRPDGGRIEYVRLFSLVAVFVLLIACINFMNLATARSIKRAKEIGVRKTIGAGRWTLIAQFIGEAMILTILAFAVAFALMILLLPAFNQLTEKQIILPLSSISFWTIVSGLILLTGFIAGSYPALYLSSFRPIKVLKGSITFSENALLFRKGLVMFQFVLSIALIIGTFVIMKQINYLQTKDLGFNKENLIYIPFEGEMANKYNVFRQEISGMPGISEVTRTDQPPTRTGSHAYDMQWNGKDPNTKTVVIHVTVGYGFLNVMHLHLLQGRDFSPDFPTDSLGYIINESTLKIIGYKNPIGQPLSIFGNNGHIIGVIKDFHFKSLHDPIEPLIINLNEHINWGNALIKTEAGKTKEAISSLEKVWSQMEPKFPFEYYFVDEDYKRLYESEKTISKLSNGFAFLAIFISCLGLLGLTIFTAEQRKKEIGIRKVIGASSLDIVLMLSRDIIKIVLLSVIVATPLAWLAMNNWLQGYAYRTSVNWWIFFISGLAALVIALSTVSFQALKSARENPVNSLRSE
ncbi:MAG TPA: ABC transporter permease [Puia sp.]|jgi:putative ABC transport system permease protein|nr:ABC transporter permease [Puia sp.]